MVMDKTSKKVLEYIASQGLEYYGAFVDTYLQAMALEIGTSKVELSAALVYLKNKNYIEFFQPYGGKANNAFRLTHEGIHYKELKQLESLERWKERLLGFVFGVLSTLVTSFILGMIG